ncbi:MAG: cation:proton antiporter [Candidatus Nanopelagicales bacterium]
MEQPTDAQMMLAAAITFGLAVGCQVIAPKLRLPALVLLLPAGFAFGALAPGLRADAILGEAFPVVVNLVVAVILFHGGTELNYSPLKRAEHSVVRRLVWFGWIITAVTASVTAYYILSLSMQIAVMLGAIVVVSGPTVVTPILQFARPNARVKGILLWESNVLDPVGALFAVVIFQVIKATDEPSIFDASFLFVEGVLVGLLGAAIGIALIFLGGRLVRGNSSLGTQVIIGSVIVAAGFANFLADDAGLLTALIMGFVAARIALKRGESLADAGPFFHTVVALSIGVLFVSIAALVPVEAVANAALPAIGLSVILIVIVRPLVVYLATRGSDLTRNERIFIGWMSPRGIVAAATASSVGATLVSLSVPTADKLLPAVFIVISVTVAVYGLTAAPLARKLGLSAVDDEPDRGNGAQDEGHVGEDRLLHTTKDKNSQDSADEHDRQEG